MITARKVALRVCLVTTVTGICLFVCGCGGAGRPKAGAKGKALPAIENGFTMDQVRNVAGRARGELKSGGEDTWLYDDFEVVFKDGKVASMAMTRTAEKTAERNKKPPGNPLAGVIQAIRKFFSRFGKAG